MSFIYRPVPPTTDFRLNVAVSIAGASATGKTYSACLLARGFTGGEPFAFIDTENNRALHYRADFPMMQHYDFGPQQDGEMLGFPPERWIAQLDAVERSGVKACVVDSFSHAWEGIGGVLEMQEAELLRLTEEAEARAQGRYTVDAAKFNQLSWVQPKRSYRRLIERIVQARMDVVLCIRAKPVMQTWDKQARKEVNARDTKLRRKDLPWDIASDRDLIFEMTASMLMEPERPGQPVLLKCPDHFRALFAGNARVSASVGGAMRAWAASGGQDPGEKALLDAAREAARRGVEAFRGFWGGLDKGQRSILSSIMDELRRTAEEADAAGDDDPFATGRDAEARALAEFERERQAEMAGAG